MLLSRACALASRQPQPNTYMVSSVVLEAFRRLHGPEENLDTIMHPYSTHTHTHFRKS